MGATLTGAVALFFPLLVLQGPAQAGAGQAGGKSAKYIVSSVSGMLSSGSLSTVTSAAAGVDPSVNADLSPVDAATAQLDPSQVSSVAAVPDVVVTPNVPVQVQDTVGDPGRAPAAVFPEQTGASQLWTQGDTGQGVNVAVLDTGISPLPDFAGRLVDGVDLSGGHNPWNDQYGHGTFVAGLIAGNGASSNGQYMGEAPEPASSRSRWRGPPGRPTSSRSSRVSGGPLPMRRRTTSGSSTCRWATSRSPRPS